MGLYFLCIGWCRILRSHGMHWYIRMNDFTKAELQRLIMGMDQYYLDAMGQQLYVKLSGMIESYNPCSECNGTGQIDNYCGGESGCCTYACSNCKSERMQ